MDARLGPEVSKEMVEAKDQELVRKRLPWVVAVALFMQQLDATIVNTAAPKMAAALGVAPLQLKSVLTSYVIAIAVCIPMSGWVADRLGTRRTFGMAVSLFTLGSLMCGLSPNLNGLIVSRLIQGIGAAFMMPVGRISMLRTFPKSELLKAMNFVLIPALIGPLLGPLMGGLIVNWMSWRMIFLINIPFGLLGLWMMKRYMPDHRGKLKEAFDGVGFLLFGSGVALLSWVLEVFGEHQMSVSLAGGLIGIAFSLIGAYVWRAGRVTAPLFPLSLFRVRTFRVSVLGGFATRLGISGMPFLLPLLYQLGMGFKPWQAGLLVMPQALAAIGMKLLVEKTLRTLGFKRILLANTVLMGCLIGSFYFVGPGTPVWVILIMSLLQGMFAAQQFTAMNMLAYADTADDEASDASSIASTSQQLSISFGIAFASLMTAWFLGGIERSNTQLLVGALHQAFLLLGGATIFSSMVFMTLKRGDGAIVSGQAVAE